MSYNIKLDCCLLAGLEDGKVVFVLYAVIGFQVMSGLQASLAEKDSIGFNQFGLSSEILRALVDLGYKTPTPIQSKAIPYVLEGKDVMGAAQTGTGKTAGYSLPVLQSLL